MGKFQFSDNNIRLDIAGHLYRIAYNSELVVKLEEMLKNTIQSQQEDVVSQHIESAAQKLCDSIDKILGNGASDTIFADRERNFCDIVDVATYIFSEFNDFQKNKTAQWKRMTQKSKK